MRLHIDGEGHGAVQYVQNMQNVHHVHRVIKTLNKFVKVGSSGNDDKGMWMQDNAPGICRERFISYYQHPSEAQTQACAAVFYVL